MRKLPVWTGPMRLPFLPLTPVCIFLGLAAAKVTARQIDWRLFALALTGALAAHLSINLFNEYHDFKSGLDERTVRTPFSGGSGTLPAHPEFTPLVLVLAWITLILTAAIGLYLVFARGWALLPLGALGLVIVPAYTRWITRHPVLCLIAPGLAFGPLFVMGTDFVLTGHYSRTAFVASLVPFFLVSNLLLLNQFPDVEADRSIGRRTLPVTIGRRCSSYLFAAFLMAPYLVMIAGVYMQILPPLSLIGLLTAILAVALARGVIHHCEDTERLLPYMALNVIVTLTTPMLLVIGIMIG